MVWGELGRMAKEENSVDRDKLIGIYIGIVAVVLAVASLGGGNASQNATLKNIEASNTWAFFQAKNIRRQIARTQAEDLELILLREPGLAPEAKAKIEAKIADYQALDKRLTSEPEKNEGLDELFKRGKALEAERNHALRQEPYFDYAQVLLQIAIVLGGVAILSGGFILLAISGILSVVGGLLTLNGFLLLFAVPFIA